MAKFMSTIKIQRKRFLFDSKFYKKERKIYLEYSFLISL